MEISSESEVGFELIPQKQIVDLETRSSFRMGTQTKGRSESLLLEKRASKKKKANLKG